MSSLIRACRPTHPGSHSSELPAGGVITPRRRRSSTRSEAGAAGRAATTGSHRDGDRPQRRSTGSSQTRTVSGGGASGSSGNSASGCGDGASSALAADPQPAGSPRPPTATPLAERQQALKRKVGEPRAGTPSHAACAQQAASSAVNPNTNPESYVNASVAQKPCHVSHGKDGVADGSSKACQSEEEEEGPLAMFLASLRSQGGSRETQMNRSEEKRAAAGEGLRGETAAAAAGGAVVAAVRTGEGAAGGRGGGSGGALTPAAEPDVEFSAAPLSPDKAGGALRLDLNLAAPAAVSSKGSASCATLLTYGGASEPIVGSQGYVVKRLCSSLHPQEGLALPGGCGGSCPLGPPPPLSASGAPLMPPPPAPQAAQQAPAISATPDAAAAVAGASAPLATAAASVAAPSLAAASAGALGMPAFPAAAAVAAAAAAAAAAVGAAGGSTAAHLAGASPVSGVGYQSLPVFVLPANVGLSFPLPASAVGGPEATALASQIQLWQQQPQQQQEQQRAPAAMYAMFPGAGNIVSSLPVFTLQQPPPPPQQQKQHQQQPPQQFSSAQLLPAQASVQQAAPPASPLTPSNIPPPSSVATTPTSKATAAPLPLPSPMEIIVEAAAAPNADQSARPAARRYRSLSALMARPTPLSPTGTGQGASGSRGAQAEAEAGAEMGAGVGAGVGAGGPSSALPSGAGERAQGQSPSQLFRSKSDIRLLAARQGAGAAPGSAPGTAPGTAPGSGAAAGGATAGLQAAGGGCGGGGRGAAEDSEAKQVALQGAASVSSPRAAAGRGGQVLGEAPEEQALKRAKRSNAAEAAAAGTGRAAAAAAPPTAAAAAAAVVVAVLGAAREPGAGASLEEGHPTSGVHSRPLESPAVRSPIPSPPNVTTLPVFAADPIDSRGISSAFANRNAVSLCLPPRGRSIRIDRPSSGNPKPSDLIRPKAATQPAGCVAVSGHSGLPPRHPPLLHRLPGESHLASPRSGVSSKQANAAAAAAACGGGVRAAGNAAGSATGNNAGSAPRNSARSAAGNSVFHGGAEFSAQSPTAVLGSPTTFSGLPRSALQALLAQRLAEPDSQSDAVTTSSAPPGSGPQAVRLQLFGTGSGRLGAAAASFGGSPAASHAPSPTGTPTGALLRALVAAKMMEEDSDSEGEEGMAAGPGRVAQAADEVMVESESGDGSRSLKLLLGSQVDGFIKKGGQMGRGGQEAKVAPVEVEVKGSSRMEVCEVDLQLRL